MSGIVQAMFSHCADKLQHSKKGAKIEAKRMTRKYGRTFVVYRCSFCNKWHIGRSNKKYRGDA